MHFDILTQPLARSRVIHVGSPSLRQRSAGKGSPAIAAESRLVGRGRRIAAGALLGLLLLAVFSTSPVRAAWPDYWSLSTGIVVRETFDDSRVLVDEISFEPPCCRSWQAGLALGYETARPWLTRWEMDLSFQSVDINQFTLNPVVVSVDTVTGFGDWETILVTANGYHDFDDDGSLDPYVGVGLGWSYLRAESNGKGFAKETRDNDSSPAGQLMLGVRSQITTGTAWSLEYRYTATGEYTFTDNQNETYDTGGLRDHQALAKLQVGF